MASKSPGGIFESDKYQLTPPYMENGSAVNGFPSRHDIDIAGIGATSKILRAQYSIAFPLMKPINVASSLKLGKFFLF